MSTEKNSTDMIDTDRIDTTGFDEDDEKIDDPPAPFLWSEGGESINAEEYLINYNELYMSESSILFRDSVIQQTISCLIGKFKPNALLVGPAGVGKTKIVEDIARRIAVKDSLIPSQLLDYTVWELPLCNIVSGSGLVGEVERKTKAILEYAQNPENKVILFIDEIHMLVGESQTYDRIAQLMKPALARGNMKVIGATTSQEAQNLINDPAFNRRFTRLIVDELSKEQTIKILSRMSDSMIKHYNNMIALDDKVIKEIVDVADNYKTIGSHRPDNAISLLDRSMADATLKIMNSDKGKEQSNGKNQTILLMKEQIKQTAMKLMTGNNEKVATDMVLLRTNLDIIKGQDEIIAYLLDLLERDNLNLFPRIKPISLLFVGNSGVGKTEIAKIISHTLTGMPPIILNMTEYSNSAALNRIIGAPAGYVGSDSKAELPFDILESNPYQVILLDEFEKADVAVQRLFMSAFDEGYIKTSKGKIVDFSKTIIIATSNAGYTTQGNAMGFNVSNYNHNIATISELSHFLDVELLNRFTRILNFNPITEELFMEILKDTYRRSVALIKNKREDILLPELLSNEEVIELKKNHYAREFGARPIKSVVYKFIEDLVLDYSKRSVVK